MKRVILLSVILLFLTTGIGFTFQNEPDGFRGLKWGDAPTEDMYFSHQILDEYLDKGNIYYKTNDKRYIGSVELFSIKYTFNLRSNQFYKVEAICKDFDDRSYNILEIIFEDKFGEPVTKKEYLLCWRGDRTFIRIYYDSQRGNLYLTIESIKIRPEDLPEIDKQGELEKAKDDF